MARVWNEIWRWGLPGVMVLLGIAMLTEVGEDPVQALFAGGLLVALGVFAAGLTLDIFGLGSRLPNRGDVRWVRGYWATVVVLAFVAVLVSPDMGGDDAPSTVASGVTSTR